MEKAATCRKRVLPPEKREILESFLALDLPLANANRKLWSFARRSHIPLGDALEEFHKRIQAIDKLDLENVSIRYRTGFGRRLDYYTGFVFEIRAPGASDKLVQKPLGGGGRYDRLLDRAGRQSTKFRPSALRSMWTVSVQKSRSWQGPEAGRAA